jgi:MOSC domain-containing protein YiiM
MMVTATAFGGHPSAVTSQDIGDPSPTYGTRGAGRATPRNPRYPDRMPNVLSVNVAQPRPNPDPRAVSATTGIYKTPTAEPVMIQAPGKAGSGLAGDAIGNPKFHGGDDQAVYVYAREDLDDWETHLNRTLTNGMFGENLTTQGIDVTGTLIGERWRVGIDGPLLEVSACRTPCRTFSAMLQERGWIKTFTQAAIPGAYLRVLAPGTVRAGDDIIVEHRPHHDVTIGLVFRARMSEPELLPQLAVANALSAEIKAEVAQRTRR